VSDDDNLEAQALAGDRRIVTMHKTGTKIPFVWASLDSTQQSTLGDNTKGPLVMAYIRGSKLNEDPAGQKYRPRQKLLGDIIHSRPVFVYDPTDPRVYVGANDGMLHSFDADTGYEVFAYIPSFFISPVATTNFSHIKALTVNPYVHNYYADGTPNVANVSLGSITKVLVGGAGAGGKGVYALNISDPTATTEAAAASKIMWEITPTTINNATSASYASLGHTYGIPVDREAQRRQLGGDRSQRLQQHGDVPAVLYVVKLIDGSLIRAISTTSPQTVSSTNPNGLSSPTAIDTNHDGTVDYVYAGDINGNLWKFDLTSSTAASWSSSRLYTTSPLQPITGRPAVSLHPLGGYMVNFGTGRMFTAADATDTTAYYAYGLRDNGTTIVGVEHRKPDADRENLDRHRRLQLCPCASARPVRVDYAATTPKHGWKLALPAGERVVGDGGLVTNTRYVFASTNPTVAHAAVFRRRAAAGATTG
jgi:type IV pilus assembly protein PilY1